MFGNRLNILLFIYVVIVLFAFSSCTPASQRLLEPETTTRMEQWAIVIGVEEYKDAMESNQYADNDAIELSQQLEQIFGNDHINLIINSDATKCNIQRSINEWLKPRVGKNDVVIFFFAGHSNAEHLRPYDSLKTSYDNDISPSELDTWLGSLESDDIVIILDCCQSGNFARDLSLPGCVIITCGTENEACWQEDIYAHGALSYYLIEAFNQLETADVNRNYEISAEEIFNYVNTKIMSEFQDYPPPSPQHPHLSDYHDGELVILQTKRLSPDDCGN